MGRKELTRGKTAKRSPTPPFQALHWNNLDAARKLMDHVLATQPRVADLWLEFAQLERWCSRGGGGCVLRQGHQPQPHTKLDDTPMLARGRECTFVASLACMERTRPRRLS